MTAHPILFMPAMVRAIIAGRKTQTRRIISPKNSTRDGWAWPKEPRDWTFDAHDWAGAYVDAGPSPAGNAGPYLKVPLPTEETVHRVYPRYQVGDCLWGKETWQFADWTEDGFPFIRYASDNQVKLVDRGISDEWAIRLDDIWQKLSTDENYAKDKKAADRKWRPSIFMPQWASRINLPIVSVRPERLQDISCEDALAEGIDHYCPGVTAALRGETEADPVAEYRTLWESINGPGSWAANPWVWVIEFKGVSS